MVLLILRSCCGGWRKGNAGVSVDATAVEAIAVPVKESGDNEDVEAEAIIAAVTVVINVVAVIVAVVVVVVVVVVGGGGDGAMDEEDKVDKNVASIKILLAACKSFVHSNYYN